MASRERSPRSRGLTGADALSDVLHSVRLTGAVFFLANSSPAWRGALPPGERLAPILLPSAQNVISYHIVVSGCCWGTLPDSPPVLLQSGDVIVFPRGDAYAIAVERNGLDFDPGPTLAQMQAMSADHFPFVVGDGEPTSLQMICGFLGCDTRPFNPLMEALPRLLVVRGAACAPDPLLAWVDLVLAESRNPVLGSECVRLRLSELLFVELVRRYLASLPDEQSGWLSALRDPVAGRALALMHDRPSLPWTVTELAKQAGVSRSGLAERFARMVGQSPMQYLTCWRMQLASRRLVENGARVSAIANEVGYDSEAAFSRAFKKVTGVAPALWRATHLSTQSSLET